MNKMAKGAIATAAGVVLLIGGGGTLAVWNADVTADAGTIQAGNLDLSATAGEWQLNNGTPFPGTELANHKIVPGDVLTYSQVVTATLVGENIFADLTVVNPAGVDAGFDDNIDTSDVVLTNAISGESLEQLTETTTADASVTFTFKQETAGRDSVNANYDFSGVKFVLEQVPEAS